MVIAAFEKVTPVELHRILQAPHVRLAQIAASCISYLSETHLELLDVEPQTGFGVDLDPPVVNQQVMSAVVL
jgi:hypothetical protein